MQMDFTIFVLASEAFVTESTDAPVVALKVGESGYYPIYTRAPIKDLNEPNCTIEVRQSAVIGSMFGWDAPAARAAKEFAARTLAARVVAP